MNPNKISRISFVLLGTLILGSLFFVFWLWNKSADVIVSLRPSAQIAAISGAGSGLVAHFTFDEGMGTTAGDSSGNGHAGTISGATWTTGKVGRGALSFDGSGLISTDSNVSSYPLSVCAWIYPKATGGFNYIVNSLQFDLFHIGFDADYFSVYNNNKSVQTLNGSVVLNAWNHVCATVDASSESIMYINGSSASSGNMGPRIASGNFSFGKNINGYLDDVLIYNRVLSASEVGELYSWSGSNDTTSSPTPIQTPDPTTPTSSDTSDTTAPSTPSGVSVVAKTSSEVTISWSVSTDAVGVAGYYVYRCQGTNCVANTQVGNVRVTSFQDTKLSVSTTYRYRVSAYDSAGNTSPSSSVMDVTTQSPSPTSSDTPPRPPTQSSPVPISDSTIPPPTVSTKFQSGDRVQVSDGPVTVRRTAAGNRISRQISGAVGTIIGGPTRVTFLRISYVWWNVNFDSGADGWVVENYLTKPVVTASRPVVTYTLSISKSGTGSGTVTTTGINCGNDCSEVVQSGTTVILTATPSSGNTFAGWSGGGCIGTVSCTVAVSTNLIVTALFNTSVSANPSPIGGTSVGSVINAASCAQGDVQAAIDQATDGKEVRIPACSSTQWSSAVVIENKNIVIRGAGQGQTVINPTGNFAFYFKTDKPFEITGMTINSAGSTMGISIQQFSLGQVIVKGFRIHHITFSNRALITWSETHGLIDNNNFNGNGTYIETFSGYAESWPYDNGSNAAGTFGRSLPIEWGTDKFLFIEDNVFTATQDSGGAVLDGTTGSRVVFRYNKAKASHFHVHSTGNNGRGFVAAEIYENEFDGSFTGGTSLWPGLIRAGTYLIFNNRVWNYYGSAHFVFDNQRSTTQNSGIQWGYCDGTKTFDGNRESSGWPCLDQIGRGIGPMGNQPTQPAYIWNNGSASNGGIHPYAGDGSVYAVAIAGQEHLIKSTPHSNGDVDFCLHSPATPCGNKPAWSYTPFTYPHPLRSAH